MTTTSATPPEALNADPCYGELRDYIIETTGLNYYAEREADLIQHVQERIATRAVSSCAEYLDLLRENYPGEEEFDALVKTLTIGETYFFRHREVFEALESRILPDVIERNRAKRTLRIWSAGCSIGAEPYSIAILLQRQFGHLVKGWDIRILGTDINRDALARARRGRFDPWAFRSAPTWLQSECFEESDGGVQILPKYAADVEFRYHNLAVDGFASAVQDLLTFDLILCRNVMIYCDNRMRRRIVEGCYECLANGGWFLVGHAEGDVELYQRFRLVRACGAILYQKAGKELETSKHARAAVSPLIANTRRGMVTLGPERPPCRGNQDLKRLDIACRLRSAGAATSLASPEPPDLAHVRALANAGQIQAAANWCRELLRRDRLHVPTRFLLGLILQQQGEHDEAERHFRQALYSDRRFVLAHYFLGLTLSQQKRHKEARRSFSNTLTLLAGRQGDEPLPTADDLTVADVVELATMHLENGTTA